MLDGVRSRAIPFSALRGWHAADLVPAWQVFHRTAVALTDGTAPLRPARPPDAALANLAGSVAARSALQDLEGAREAFAGLLEPVEIETAGFLTGYYEPVVDGSPVQTPEFQAPVLPRPDDLVTLSPDETVSGLPAGYSAARRDRDGALSVYADRAALEDRALHPNAGAIAWLRDWTEVFLVQVQGSARVRFPDGKERRLVYAGRNGHPYTSVGRILIESGEIDAKAMTLDGLKSWIRRNGQNVGDTGRSLMQRNRSFIFFRLEPARDGQGPIGGAGLPLTPRRSIAVDRTIWSYGLPFWIESERPVPGFGPQPIGDLFIAQDTGSAILGPARADLFLGSGEAAGRDAGSIRHQARFVAFLPRDR